MIKQANFQFPEENPGFLLWRASTLWRRAIESVLKPLGLTHPQFVILATVAWLTREGEKSSQVEISKHAELDPTQHRRFCEVLKQKILSKDHMQKMKEASIQQLHLLDQNF